MQVILHVAGL